MAESKRAHIQSTRGDGWTKSKRATFLTVLGETCNATIAARAVGLSVRGAHALRARDGGFALLWSAALESGYELLENELLFRALGQPGGANPDEDEIEAVRAPDVPFDPALAIKVLEMRRGPRSASKPKTSTIMSQGEVDAALLKRLDALAAKRP